VNQPQTLGALKKKKNDIAKQSNPAILLSINNVLLVLKMQMIFPGLFICLILFFFANITQAYVAACIWH
jgi:hypothetical protein